MFCLFLFSYVVFGASKHSDERCRGIFLVSLRSAWMSCLGVLLYFGPVCFLFFSGEAYIPLFFLSVTIGTNLVTCFRTSQKIIQYLVK